jgi:hypothetical protein
LAERKGIETRRTSFGNLLTACVLWSQPVQPYQLPVTRVVYKSLRGFPRITSVRGDIVETKSSGGRALTG